MVGDFLWKNPRNAHVGGLIDFTSGIFACNTGHFSGNLASRVRMRLNLAIKNAGIHSYTYRTRIREQYEKSLTEWAGYGGVYLFTTGSEAVEAALRLVRGYRQRSKRIWGIAGSFHGKTLFSQLPSPFGTWIQLESILDGHVRYAKKRPAGIIVEGYRGWDCHFWEPQVINWLRMWQARGALIIFDEVQSGFGRTGRKFAYEWYEITPDIVVIGKGSHSGFPGSAILASSDILNTVLPGELSSTHGGGPLACAAGLATIEEFERLDLVSESERKGVLLHEAISHFPVSTSGRGLVAALHFDTSVDADAVVRSARQAGLLVVHTGKSTVKIGPPLTIPDDVLMEGLEILKGVLDEVLR